jgi:hypothetical protein
MHWRNLLVLAVLALALGAFSSAEAARPRSSDQLRAAKVVTKTGSGSISIANFADPEGSSNGVLNADSLVVIDFITYTEVTGGAAENWTLTIADDSGDIMLSIKQTVAANTADNIYAQWPLGFPMFEGSIAASTFTQGSVTCRSGYAVAIAGPSTTGSLTVGYHYELPADRAR